MAGVINQRVACKAVIAKNGKLLVLRAQHNDCQMLLQIHDSILVECPAEVAERIAKLLKDTMESAYKLPVKLTAETAIGRNWGEL